MSSEINLETIESDLVPGQDGGEFLHRILWENRISHEYRLLQDCDHVGASLPWRTEDAHRWIGRMAKTLIDPQPIPKPTEAQVNYLQYANENWGKCYASQPKRKN